MNNKANKLREEFTKFSCSGYCTAKEDDVWRWINGNYISKEEAVFKSTAEAFIEAAFILGEANGKLSGSKGLAENLGGSTMSIDKIIKGNLKTKEDLLNKLTKE